MIIGCALQSGLDKASPDQFPPVQTIGICGFGNITAGKIAVNLLQIFGCETESDIAKLDC